MSGHSRGWPVLRRKGESASALKNAGRVGSPICFTAPRRFLTGSERGGIRPRGPTVVFGEAAGKSSRDDTSNSEPLRKLAQVRASDLPLRTLTDNPIPGRRIG